MNSAKLQDTKSIYKKKTVVLLYTNNKLSKEELRKQSHL